MPPSSPVDASTPSKASEVVPEPKTRQDANAWQQQLSSVLLGQQMANLQFVMGQNRTGVTEVKTKLIAAAWGKDPTEAAMHAMQQLADERSRANRLSDECGELRTERDELLRENAVLRRRLEKLEKKR